MRLLIVHSSADLYGSDRSLLSAVRLERAGTETTIALPEDGPLRPLLEQQQVQVRVLELGKFRSDQLTPARLLRTGRLLWQAVRQFEAWHREAPFDVVYSNSIVVFAGALFARRHGLPHVWHVREIPAQRRIRQAFGWLVPRLSTRVVANSTQTRDALGWSGRADCRVVWNGVEPVGAAAEAGAEKTPEAPADPRWAPAASGGGTTPLVIGMVGRLNAWKGQGLLLQAVRELLDRGPGLPPFELRIVGSAYRGQEHYETGLREQVQRLRLDGLVRFQGFVDDMRAIWPAIDIAVVPSTQPEPFGRVAIEAMACAKPVVAAAHGGLRDIVDDGRSGLLFEPGSAPALATALGRLLGDATLRRTMGEAGRRRQCQLFSEVAYARSLSGVWQDARAAAR